MRKFTGVSGATDDGLAKLSPAPATRWTPEVANSIVLELATAITHADGGDADLDPDDNGQLLAAMLAIVGRAVTVTGQSVDFAGKFILKVGTYSASLTEGTLAVPFPVSFPNGCWGVIPVAINASGANNRDLWAEIVSWDEGGFVAMLNGPPISANVHQADGIVWVAFGT